MTQIPAAHNPDTPLTSPAETLAERPASTDKHRVYNLIILDESGSMERIRQATISGFNETLQTIQHAEREHTDQQHFVAVVPFNSCRPFDRFELQTTDALKLLDEQTYRPACSTPLYDAIGFGINWLSKAIAEPGGTYNVLVTILTDGEENASRSYSGLQIKTMIDTLKPLGWLFTYMGANHDVERAAAALSINHRVAFEASSAGITSSLDREQSSRRRVYARMKQSRSEGRVLTDEDVDYFSDAEK